MNSLDDKKNQELEEKLNNFESFIEDSIKMAIQGDQESVNAGSYKYLIEEHNANSNFPLSEDLEKALSKSNISQQDLTKKAIKDGMFEMEYEELASPFDYGSEKENEFYCLPWGGDKETQVDKSDEIENLMPSFSLKDHFGSLREFEDYVSYNIGRFEHIKHYWDFAVKGSDIITVTYNNDYDVVRCLLTNEDELIEFLKENSKPKPAAKILKITTGQYHELRNNNDGFCVSCGKVNEGFHEPDAEHYECANCGEEESFGMESLLVSGKIDIVDSEEESTLDDSF